MRWPPANPCPKADAGLSDHGRPGPGHAAPPDRKGAGAFDLSDTLPPELLQRLGLPGFAEAIRFLHNPPPEISQAALEARDFPAWRRMQFDELLAQQLSCAAPTSPRRARGAPRRADREADRRC
jgi:RecG-like helicase